MLAILNFTDVEASDTTPYPFATIVKTGSGQDPQQPISSDPGQPAPIVHLRETRVNLNDLRISPPRPGSLTEYGFEVLWQRPSDFSYDDFGTIIGSDERCEITQ